MLRVSRITFLIDCSWYVHIDKNPFTSQSKIISGRFLLISQIISVLKLMAWNHVPSNLVAISNVVIKFTHVIRHVERLEFRSSIALPLEILWIPCVLSLEVV